MLTFERPHCARCGAPALLSNGSMMRTAQGSRPVCLCMTHLQRPPAGLRKVRLDHDTGWYLALDKWLLWGPKEQAGC